MAHAGVGDHADRQAWIESLNGHLKAEYPHQLAISSPAPAGLPGAANTARINVQEPDDVG